MQFMSTEHWLLPWQMSVSFVTCFSELLSHIIVSSLPCLLLCCPTFKVHSIKFCTWLHWIFNTGSLYTIKSCILQPNFIFSVYYMVIKREALEQYTNLPAAISATTTANLSFAAAHISGVLWNLFLASKFAPLSSRNCHRTNMYNLSTPL